MTAGGLAGVSFVAGVFVGIALAEVRILLTIGQTSGMRLPRVRRLSARSILIGALLVALVVNALLGFLLIAARAATEQTAEDRNALVGCLVDYNTRLGDALAERDAVGSDRTASEIRLWNRYDELYRRAKKDPKSIPAAQDELHAAIRAHRDDLVSTQGARSSSPYPPSDLCVDVDPKGMTK